MGRRKPKDVAFSKLSQRKQRKYLAAKSPMGCKEKNWTAFVFARLKEEKGE